MQSKLQRPSKVKCDESRKMMACQFNGKEDLRMNQVSVPMITDPTDAIVKVTAASICGMDLSLFHDMIPGMMKGSIIGHESVGIVDSVGPQVTGLKKGDRVIISSVIACGQCEYCKRREWSSCETTNPCDEQEKMYGSHTSAVLGTGPTFGGLEGSLAEYVRVPFAQVNLIRIPNNITDKQAVLVSDVASTALHANVLADVKQGDRVAVIGCGPVGMLTQMWAKLRGAEMVIGIDTDQQRLSMVKDRVGSMIVNSKETDMFEAVRKLVPGGPDKVIDCVGSTCPEGALHKAGMMLKMETDSPNIVNMAIRMVRKNGRVTLIGDYMGCTNQFNIGGLMEKNLMMTGGRVSPQNYAEEVMGVISSGKIDPTIVFTHTIPMSKTDQIWKKLDRHEEGMMKVLILPDELANRVEGVSK